MKFTVTMVIIKTCSGDLCDRLVVFGMSCSGKTTMARSLTGREAYCFDSLFPWHDIESLGLPTGEAMRHVRGSCVAPRFVLDGWHLSDPAGDYLPAGSAVVVVYADYDFVVSQYRVPVADPGQHLPMYKKWYLDIDYKSLPGVRYFRNEGSFVETCRGEFVTCVNSIPNSGTIFTKESR